MRRTRPGITFGRTGRAQARCRFALAHLYDPAAATDGALTLAGFMASRFGGTPAVGDRTRFGAVELIVRDMQGDEITQVGVELDPAPKHRWRSWLRLLYWRLG